MINALLNINKLEGATLGAGLMLVIPLFVFAFLILFGRMVKKYRGIAATGFMLVNTLVAAYLFFQVESETHYNYHLNSKN